MPYGGARCLGRKNCFKPHGLTNSAFREIDMACFTDIRRVCVAILLPLLSSAALATPIFVEDFESGLSKWNPIGSAKVVTDPFDGANKAINFAAGGSGGDIFSSQPYLDGGTYHLSFDVLGTCTSGNCGAFIGIDQFPGGEIWIAGDNTYNPKLYLMQNTGAWQHFDLVFTANAAGKFRLKMEDFSASPPPGDIYFDNICVSAVANDAGCPSSSSVPEPGSIALVALALAGLGLLPRRRRG
jgi:hypothetical protein